MARCIVGVLILLAAVPSYGQAPFLVKDILAGTTTQGSAPQRLITFGSNVYFTADTPATGRELWKSDGTPAGTMLVKDINPGPASSSPETFVISNGILFFFADDGTHGFEPWRTDGTGAGTVMIKDVIPGRDFQDQNFSGNAADVGGTLFFQAGNRLWKSNGTTAGTVEVFPNDIFISQITNLNGVAIFRGDLVGDTDGPELWRSNGTSAGTFQVKDINVGTSGSNPSNFKVAGTLAYFSVTGGALWRTDGTDPGTQLILNLGFSTNSLAVGAVGTTMYFRADDGSSGSELWKTQGTPATTFFVKDINPSGSSAPCALINFNGVAFFDAITATNGRELWKSDGTESGTVLVKDMDLGTTNGSNCDAKVILNNTLYFGAWNNSGVRQLWKSDGTTAGTVEVSSFASGSSFDYVASPAVLSTKILFDGFRPAEGEELWGSDGTSAGTALVKDLLSGSAGSSPEELTDVAGMVFFSAADTPGGARKLWKSDGTEAGTVVVKNVSPTSLVAVGPTLFFSSTAGGGGEELWISDGTDAGTVRVKDIRPGSTGSSPSKGVALNGILYFTADNGTQGRELWRSDGTDAGTTIVRDITPGHSNPSELTPLGNVLLFAATSADGTELWKSNGTDAGTVLVKDIVTGSGGSFPHSLCEANGILFFAAQGNSSIRLWKSDGFDAGTVLVTGANAAPSSPDCLGSFSGQAFMVELNPSTGSASGKEAWKSDGTAPGTLLIEDIFPGVGGSGINELASTATMGFFAAGDATAGRELWKTTDGTPAGTSRIADISPGLRGSNPTEVMTSVGSAVFAADDGTNGNELWLSNGTTATLINNMTPGAASSPIRSIVESGPFLFFVGDNGSTGLELYALSMSRLCTPPAAPTISSSSPSGICQGQSVTLTASSGYSSYRWSNLASTQAITVSPDVTTTYSVFGYNASACPTARRTHTVNVTTPLSNVSAVPTGSTTVCHVGTAGTINVTDTGGGTVTHQWGYRTSSGGTITNITGQTGTSYLITGSHFPNPGNYWVVVRSSPTCGPSTVSNEVPVIVTAALTSATMSITGSNQVCSASTGGTATANTTGGVTLSYQWGYRYTSTGSFHAITGATASTYLIRGSDFVPEAAGPQTYFLECVVTPSCGTPMTTNQNSVTVTPTPNTPAASNSGPICQGTQLQLSTATVTGATYAWTGPNGFTSPLQNPTLPNATTAASGEYRVTVTVNGCTSAAGITNVTVKPIPTASPSSNSPVCEGSTLTLSTPLVSGATYSWTGPNGFISSSRTPNIPSATPAAAGTYSVVVTLNGCSSPSQTVDVTIKPRPVVSASNSGPVCVGSSATLNATTIAGATYSWTGPGGFSSTQQNPVIASATLAHAGTYSVIATLNACQSVSSPTQLVVNTLPSATITAPAAINAAADGTASAPSAGSGATYDWTVTNGAITAGLGTRNISFTAGLSGSVGLTVRVTSAAGCFTDGAESIPIIAIPVVTGMNPSEGTGGTSVQISGSNFVDVLAVRFNGRASEFEVLSPSSIRATVPALASTGPISVVTTTGTGTSGTNFIVPPKINSFSPPSGLTGSTVTINGTNLLQTSSVHFGTVPANFSVPGSNTVEAIVPPGAKDSQIVISTPDGSATTATDFIVLQVPFMIYTRLDQPCRIVDTRSGGGALTAGAPRHFRVAGDSGFEAQGGTPGGCGVPTGEATAAFLNLVAVNPSAAGNLRGSAFPNDVPASGSVINYQATSPILNVANGLIFPICDAAENDCSEADITLLANGGTTQLVADVLGYFTRVVREETRSFALTRRFGSLAIPDPCTNLSSITLQAPVNGTVVVRANVVIAVLHQVGTTDTVIVSMNTDSDACQSDLDLGEAGQSVIDASMPSGTYYPVITIQRTFAVLAGPEQFFLNGSITSGDAGQSIHSAGLTVMFYPD